MTPPSDWRADRRVWLFLLTSLLAVWLGFFCLTPDQSMQVVIYGGYWAMLGLTLLFSWALWRLIKTDWPDWRAHWRTTPRWPVALVAAGGTLLLVHEAYGFKILMDEVMLLGTSMSMHFNKTALVPMRGHDIQGAFQLLSGQLDKRPLFQPFLVSLFHDFTGYRPENPFILNTLLTYLLMALAYLTGVRIGGRRAGALAVVLLAGLPLLAQNATGAGFEILNLVMILSTLLLGMRYLRRRDPDSLQALVLSAVLLADTRYESVLFLLPVGLTILWVWWCDRRATLTGTVLALPLLLLPYALHNQVFRARASSWEMASQPGHEVPFSVSYVPDNLSHALNFFFNTNGEQSNSLVLSWLGFAALVFFGLWVLRTLRRLREATPERAALALFSLGLLAHTLLLFCYFWGKFDDPVIRRLSLPLHLTLVLAIITVAAELDWRGWLWRGLAVVSLAGYFSQSLPAMARHGYTLEYYVGREMEWRRAFITAHPERDYHFIDNNTIIWITHLVSSTPVFQVLQHKENIVFNFQNRIFSSIYVFQRLLVDPATGITRVPADEELGPDYQLETVWERRFTPMTVSRISRVVSIKAGPSAAPAGPPPSIDRLSPAEQEQVRADYLAHFIKRLP